MNRPIMTMKMKNGQEIKMELYPDVCKNSVDGIIWMINQNGFKDMQIQRIKKDWVLQPWYDEERMDEMYQYMIESETIENGYPNSTLPFKKYAVGMAGAGKYMSSNAFFIALHDDVNDKLYGKFPCVGYVISGFDEVDRIVNVPLRTVNAMVDEPIVPEVIDNITVDLNGYEPSMPVQFLPESYLLKKQK